VLILNKKTISNHENQLFQAELEKFRPYQNRLLQANHKQTALMKELTKSYGILLQDKRVRSEQAKYEAYTRQRNLVLSKYMKVYQAFNDLLAGKERAISFYSEMEETVESLGKNVQTFVNNRRSEGAQLLGQIEREKSINAGSQADRERDRLREIMERMSIDPALSSSPTKSNSRPAGLPRPSQPVDSKASTLPTVSSPHYKPHQELNAHQPFQHTSSDNGPHQGLYQNPSSSIGNHQRSHQRPVSRESPAGISPLNDPYNPMAYPFQTPVSPPLSNARTHYNPNHSSHPQYHQHTQYLPPGYIPPPPPPGPPPSAQHGVGSSNFGHPAAAGTYAFHQAPPPLASDSQREQMDPWSALHTWK
jgi:hypothetical protein